MHIQLDPLGGIAGDMFIAAVVDAWPDLAPETFACIRQVAEAPDWPLTVVAHNDGTFAGVRFDMSEPSNEKAGHHHHRHHADIVRLIEGSGIEPQVREHALGIFRRLAEAESRVHGVPVDDVTFHEVGAWDSIGDIVGAAFLIHKLALRSWSLGPVPLGRGRIQTAHGPMPVPAPATAILLEGFAVIDDGIGGERVTPTGAAILRYLADLLGMPSPVTSEPMVLTATGTGFGTRTMQGISNVCRILAFEPTANALQSDQVGIICFEIDDQSAEDLALGIDAIRSVDGVLDVLQIAGMGKKGRMVVQLQVMCQPSSLQRAIEGCFAQTSTLGLRWSIVARTTLSRRTYMDGRATDGVAVKVAHRPDGRQSAKVEAESVRGKGGRLEREALRRTAEDNVLRQAQQEDQD